MKRLAYSAVVKPLATKAGCVLLTLLTAAFTQMALAVTTFYVTTNGTGNLSGSDWANATNNLQGAIDTIETGATNTNTVWVSNGVYSVGGVTNYPAGSLLTNRVAITKAITVQSWNNDPMNTIIKGSWSSNGQTNGADAVRCVYMAANSRLIGFTLTNGATLASGDTAYGAICGVNVNAIVSNCIVTGCTGKDEVIGYASLYNCSIINNPFTGDSTYHILACTLYNCVVAFNTSYRLIGDSIIYNSLVVSNNNYYNKNSSYIIGGRSSIYNSIIAYNIPYALTGSWPKMQNCLIYGNKALYAMVTGGNLTNCTVVGNRIDSLASYINGGGVGSTAGGITCVNCIVYGNTNAGFNTNYLDWAGYVTWGNSCTTPTNPAGSDLPAGFITNDPLFVARGSGMGATYVPGNLRLSSSSPCVNTGTNAPGVGDWPDLDGRTRIRYGTVDMGCYERINSGTLFIGR